MDAFLDNEDFDIDSSSVFEILHFPKKDVNYATWLENGNDYAPATTLKPVEKLPSGVYKMIVTNDGYRATPVPINSDELYTFTDGYTTTILNEVNEFWKKKDLYKKYNLSPRRGLLLEGPPGSGKSSIITLLIEQLIKKDGIVFLVNTIADLNVLTESINTVIRKIEPERPIITIIEDVDKLIAALGTDAILLDLMDGKNSIDNHLIILTSNNTTDLSPALLRPSRIDMRFEMPNPTESIRKEFFEKKGIKDIDKYVNATEGMSFAELKEVFIGTQILGKKLNKVIDQIKNPLETKDYFNTKKKKIGL